MLREALVILQIAPARYQHVNLTHDYSTTILVLDEVRSACLRTSASDSSALEVAELQVKCEVDLSVSMPAFANVAFTQRAIVQDFTGSEAL